MPKVCNYCHQEKKKQDFYLSDTFCKDCRKIKYQILKEKKKLEAKRPPILKKFIEKYGIDNPTKTQLKDFEDNR